MPFTSLTNSQIDLICNLYISGRSITSLCDEFHIRFSRIKKLLLARNIQLRTHINTVSIPQYTKDEILPSGSIIFWSRGYESDAHHTKAWVQCYQCKQERFVIIHRKIRNKLWTGRCIQCKNHHERSKNSSNWKGGKRNHGGYIHIHLSILSLEDLNLISSMIYRSYILEHRLVMAKHLRRPLLKSEIVHHLNGIKTDNRLCNLQLVTVNTHRKEEEKLFTSLKNEIARLQTLLDLHSISY